MGVKLTVDKGGMSKDIWITDVETACRGWGSIARELKLREYDGDLPIYINPGNLSGVLAGFRSILKASPPEPQHSREALADLICRLERLGQETNWEAILQ